MAHWTILDWTSPTCQHSQLKKMLRQLSRSPGSEVGRRGWWCESASSGLLRPLEEEHYVKGGGLIVPPWVHTIPSALRQAKAVTDGEHLAEAAVSVAFWSEEKPLLSLHREKRPLGGVGGSFWDGILRRGFVCLLLPVREVLRLSGATEGL